MTEARRELTQREREILELREQKVTYKKIAEMYGVSVSRAQSICRQAQRRLREEQRRVLISRANQVIVPTAFTRSQLIIIRDALSTMQNEMRNNIVHTHKKLTELEEKDPVYRKAGQVLLMVEKLLESTRGDIQRAVLEGTKQTVPEMLDVIHGGGERKRGTE